MSTCKYCGAEYKPLSSRGEDYCKWVGDLATRFKGRRSFFCYERQVNNQQKEIAELLKLLDEAREYVAEVASDYYGDSEYYRTYDKGLLRCSKCHFRKKDGHYGENCFVKQAQDLLERLDKLLSNSVT